MKKLFTSGLLILAITALYSQPIIMPYPTPAQDLVKGYSESLVTVRVVFATACNSNTATIQLPAGVSYVPGSLIVTATSGPGMSELNISNLRVPVFTIDNAALGADLTFTIARRADCAAPNSGKDSVVVVGSCGTATENASGSNQYNINEPAFSLSSPAALTNQVVGGTATRNFSITNGGVGMTDTLRFFVVYPSGGIEINNATDELLFNGVAFTPSSSNGDTLFYKVFGATLFGGNNLFENGESVSVSEPIIIRQCNAATNYGAQWGRNPQNICQTATGTGTVTMATGVPSFTSTATGYLGFVNMCTPFEYAFTITNNGSGNPIAAAMYNVVLRHGLNHFNNQTNIINNSAFYTILGATIGGNPVTISYTGSTMRIHTSQFNSDPDGIGVGLEDLDGDGFFDDLPVGHSVTVRIQMQYNDIVTCGSTNMSPGYAHPPIGPVRNVEYTTMCDPLNVISPQNNQNGGGFYYYGSSTQDPNVNVAANVLAGTPFRPTFSTNPTNFNWPTNSGTRWQWRIILPPDFSVSGTGNPTYNGVATTYTQSGDTIIIEGSVGPQFARPMAIDLVFTCGTSGPTSIPYEIHRIDDAPNACFSNRHFICNSFPLNAQGCPGPCPGGGPTTHLPMISRIQNSLGYTSSNLTTRANPASVSAYSRSHAKYGDTIEVSVGMTQNGSFNNLYSRFQLDKTTGGIDKLDPIEAEAFFYTSGVLTGSCVLSTANVSMANSTATVQVIDWNLSACIPGGLINNADSVHLIAKYRIPINTGLPNVSGVLVPGGEIRFFNLDAMNNEQSCNYMVPDLYLFSISHFLSVSSAGGTTINPSGCSTGSRSLGLHASYSGTDVTSSGEHIPAFYVDSMIFNVTSGFILTGINIPVLGFITPDVISGNTYRFYNNGSWPVTQLASNGSILTFAPIVRGSCSAPATGTLTGTAFSRDFYYQEATPFPGLNPNPPIHPQARGFSIPITYSNPPDFTLTNLSGTKQLYTSTEFLDFQIANSTLVSTPYVWIALPNNPNVTVLNLIDLATMLPVTPIPYAGGNWYQVFTTPGLASSSTQNFRINFNYTSCSMDSLRLLAGWNCGSFPTDPSAYPCDAQELFLRFLPQPSEVQSFVALQPPANVDLCTPGQIIFAYNSAQSARVLNPYMDVFPPVGFDITSFQLEYPQGSGIIETLTPTPIAGGFRINFNDHTGINPANGLPGTFDNPTTPGRSPQLIVNYELGCSFISGSDVISRSYGTRPCGAPASGNGVIAQSNSIHVTGAPAPTPFSVVLNVDPSVSSLPCGGTTTLFYDVTSVIEPTTATDTLVVTLPPEMSYQGNFTGINNCAGCQVVTESLPSGQTLVKVAVGAGVAELVTIDFSFQCSPSVGGCGNVALTSYMKRDITPFMCGAVPCASSSVITGQAPIQQFDIDKPNLIVTQMLEVGIGRWHPGVTTDVSIAVQNTGTLNAAANAYFIELYCGVLDVPFTTISLPNAINIGQTVVDTFTLTIPNTPTCNEPENVSAKFAKTVNPGGGPQLQCLCDSSQFTFLYPLPVNFGEISTECLETGVEVRWSTLWEENNSHFEVLRSQDGLWEVVGKVQGNGNAFHSNYYTFTDAKLGGYVNYRIKQTDYNGKSAYSKTIWSICPETPTSFGISIHPNPFNQELQVQTNGNNEIGRIVIYNAVGAIVYDNTIASEQSTINTAHFAPGMYMLRVNGLNYKIIKQ